MVERYKPNVALRDGRTPGFKKGNTYGKGRKKGIPNRVSGLVKDWLAGASGELGFLEPVWRMAPNPRNTADRRYPDIKVEVIGWRPGEGGGQGFLVWLGCNHPTAFAQLLGRVMPLQINATATIEQTVTTKFSDADISGMSLTEKLAAFRELIGMTRALPPPDENRAPSGLRMIEGEAISEED
jgi:hypothetical protein